MKKIVIILGIITVYLLNNAYAKDYISVEYTPLSQEECMSLKDDLGLKYCPFNNDHLAGAAKACGHIENLPTGNDLQLLALKLYKNRVNSGAPKTTIYGKRNDELMQDLLNLRNSGRIFLWIGEEYKDEKSGFVRVFDPNASIPYFTPRNGKGYMTQSVGLVEYGNTDVLAAVCYK